MRNWWVNQQGENLLEGLPADPDDPEDLGTARLSDDAILQHMARIPAARSAYLAVRGQLTEDERARLEPLYNHAIVQARRLDPQDIVDSRQHSWNTRIPRIASRRR